MPRKEILTRARNDLIAEQDKEIAAKILATKTGSVDAYNKKMDAMLNEAIKEYTEEYTKKVEALKLEYNNNVKTAQDGTKASKEKNLQSEIDTITHTIQVQYASDIDNLTKHIDAIKE
jgi:phage host-nuclease inhibitor protein Gam